jgi:glycosidase
VLDTEDRDIVSIGEMHLYDWDEWARYFGGHAGGGLDELHMPFNFSLLKTPWRAADMRAAVDALEAHLPEGGWPNYVLGNHDERRLRTRIGAAQARVAAVLLLTLRGTPTLYYGDELGLPEVDVPEAKLQDPWGLRSLPELSRDGCRTPMAWDATPAAGFSDADPAALWLPLHDTHAVLNVETELADSNSMLNLYRRLLDLRKASPALHVGTYAPVDDAPEGVFAYERMLGDDRVFVALNFSDEAQQVMLPANLAGTVRVSTHREREDRTFAGTIRLAAHEGVVVV